MNQTELLSGFATDLAAAVALLRKRERRWRKSGRKKDLYRFLNTILAFYAAWRNADMATSAAERVVLIAGGKLRSGRHPIRAIIDAVSLADRRTKSRWARGLRYAWGERRNWNSLKQCLRANGGVAGCADKWTELHPKTPHGYVRVGGEHRVPLIPLFVRLETPTPPSKVHTRGLCLQPSRAGPNARQVELFIDY
jgi:hypothetical protein